MPDIQTLRGGAPTKSEILVNVDHDTIEGDGSIENPIRATGGSSDPTTEHVAVGAGGGAVAPSTDVSFVRYSGLLPEGPITIELTLANGSTDGQPKTVSFEAQVNVIWKLTPTSFEDGSDVVITADASGAVSLVWDATAVGWRLVSTFNGTLE